MTAPINGHAPEPEASETPPLAVARAVYTNGVEDGDTAFDELDAEDREALIAYADEHIQAHMAHLAASGFRLLPPGAMLRPHSKDEALAMLQASKDFFDAQKRKPGLVGSVAPRKLILPKGSKLQ